ncbi:MAG: DUF2179 domain-containing protein [Clostridia bacterium]
MEFDVFNYVILPLLIFVSRIFDVTLGTLRIIFVSRGKKFIAPILGFFEVLIWIMVIAQIISQLDNAFTYIAYALGFAVGNLVGILIEEKLAVGMYVVRIFLLRDECGMKKRLSDAGFGVTSVQGMGASKPVTILYSIIKRKDMNKVVEIIHACDSKSFYSIEDVRSVYEGVFPGKSYGLAPGTSSDKKRFLGHFIRKK